MYIAEQINNRIRKVTILTGIITTIAGSSTSVGFSGDNGAATSAKLYYPKGVGLDSSGIQYYFLTLQIFVTLFLSHIQYRQRVHR